MDTWVTELQALNSRLKQAFADVTLLPRHERRRLLSKIGTFRTLERLSDATLTAALDGRPFVGVDGTINMFGGAYPHYLALLRAVAKPNRDASVVDGNVYCPMPSDDDGADEIDNAAKDETARQGELAKLEAKVAAEAIVRYEPSLLLMDGPLVRFYMRANNSFMDLREKSLIKNILLVGVVENIESKTITTLFEQAGEEMPAGWRHRYDYDLLWDMLDYGELFEVSHPGFALRQKDEEEKPLTYIRRWFLRSSLAQGVIGLDVLEEQVPVAKAIQLAEMLFTLTPRDGRGIPIWMDIVDREVRLTDVELHAYMDFLDPDLRRILEPKRNARNF